MTCRTLPSATGPAFVPPVEIPIDDARRMYQYDPDNGSLIFGYRRESDFPKLVNPKKYVDWFNSNRFGNSAYMSPYPNGYLRVSVLGKTVLAHRFIWFLKTESWPIGVIDHLNGDRSDNSWRNLRDVSFSENSANHKTLSTSKYPITGISYLKSRDVYVVSVTRNGKRLPIRWCKTLDEAIRCRISMGNIPNVQKRSANECL